MKIPFEFTLDTSYYYEDKFNGPQYGISLLELIMTEDNDDQEFVHEFKSINSTNRNPREIAKFIRKVLNKMKNKTTVSMMFEDNDIIVEFASSINRNWEYSPYSKDENSTYASYDRFLITPIFSNIHQEDFKKKFIINLIEELKSYCAMYIDVEPHLEKDVKEIFDPKDLEEM